MSNSPVLSVYMPVYNGGPYLATAIRSVLDQTFSDFEFLIVDDGSTDDSVATVESFKDPRIRLLSQENQGCYPARNRAIAEARGQYLANMDADDISLPERFEKQIAYLEKYPEAVLVGTRSYGCDREDTFRLPQRIDIPFESTAPIPNVVDKVALQSGPLFAYQTVLFRRSLIDSIGPYDDRLCYAADVDFVARAALAGYVVCLPEYLFVFRIVPTAISGAGSQIQRQIISMIGASISRSESGNERVFSKDEIGRLAKLSEQRMSLPFVPSRHMEAYYETRLATLLRVNGKYREAMRHALRAIMKAPENLVRDKKLLSTLLKCGFGLRPNRP